MKFVDLIELRRSASRQLEAPKMPMGDDLEYYIPFVSFSNIPFLKPDNLFVRKNIFVNPALVVLKEELAAQRMKHEALEAKIEEIVQTQSTLVQSHAEMKAQQDEMQQCQNTTSTAHLETLELPFIS
jgi:predicted nuclease with TOPRIM domain